MAAAAVRRRGANCAVRARTTRVVSTDLVRPTATASRASVIHLARSSATAAPTTKPPASVSNPSFCTPYTYTLHSDAQTPLVSISPHLFYGVLYK